MGELKYLSGFDNEHESEAIAGALPQGQFSPQRHPLGLYAEKFSATAFTAPRHQNRRSWLYRIRPSVVQGSYQWTEVAPSWLSAPLAEVVTPPDPMRWSALPLPTEQAQDFVSGMTTMAANGTVLGREGLGIHCYLANRSMESRFLVNADGEMLIVPQSGRLRLRTEFGVLEIAPNEIAVIPRGVKFSVELLDGAARGFVAENYGVTLELPERGPVGSDGYANDRDFLYPQAAFEDNDDRVELITKFGGNFFANTIEHSPLDVVAWVGNSAPYKYDLARFNTMGSISYDHPDPSIFTVLTSPSGLPGVANLDFVVFPPRWLVAENTFRPPWYHRNTMSEFMGLVVGEYDAKPGDSFGPGGMTLHNCMTPHGPDSQAFAAGSNVGNEPQKLADTMAFMFESRLLMQPSAFALGCPERDRAYHECWQGLTRIFPRD